MKKQIDAKTTMLLHSEAKVEFYKKYIERYMRILYLAEYIDEINVFDVFCGTGIYENKKKGSPLVAFDAIKNIVFSYDKKKIINLVVNDSEDSKILTVQEYIDSKNRNYCNVTYHNKPAEQMFNEINSQINAQKANVRNLIFIDPYGYKQIKKQTLQELLKMKRTEIILFLPISQMQRFTTKAIESDLKPYEPLKEFIYSFFEGSHPIKEQKVKALDYIHYIKEALRFSDYYSTSYYIERDNSNYYALFFISPNIFGFQKILEVKWQLDDDEGLGFKQPNPQGSLFEIQEKANIKSNYFERLESILKNELLKKELTNKDLYDIILRNEFLPKHANEIFAKWQKEMPSFKVWDCETKKDARKNSFYIDWKYFNPSKDIKPKVIFKIIRKDETQ